MALRPGGIDDGRSGELALRMLRASSISRRLGDYRAIHPDARMLPLRTRLRT
jgi:hypothetical protein